MKLDRIFTMKVTLKQGFFLSHLLRVSFLLCSTVELHVVERANRAILIDASPPVQGIINDGTLATEDMRYTKDAHKVSLQ